jgi:hypothetical protein
MRRRALPPVRETMGTWPDDRRYYCPVCGRYVGSVQESGGYRSLQIVARQVVAASSGGALTALLCRCGRWSDIDAMVHAVNVPEVSE